MIDVNAIQSHHHSCMSFSTQNDSEATSFGYETEDDDNLSHAFLALFRLRAKRHFKKEVDLLVSHQSCAVDAVKLEWLMNMEQDAKRKASQGLKGKEFKSVHSPANFYSAQG